MKALPLPYMIALHTRKDSKPPKNYKYISKLKDSDIEKAFEKIKKWRYENNRNP